jgi:hypothetical protein
LAQTEHWIKYKPQQPTQNYNQIRKGWGRRRRRKKKRNKKQKTKNKRKKNKKRKKRKKKLKMKNPTLKLPYVAVYSL